MTLPELGTLALLATLTTLTPTQALIATLIGSIALLNHHFLTSRRRPSPPLWTLTLPYTLYYALTLALPGQPGLQNVAIMAALILVAAASPAPRETLPLAAPLAASMAAALALSIRLGLEPAALYAAGPLLEHYWLRALPAQGRTGKALAPLLIASFYHWDPRIAAYVLASTLARGAAGEKLSARLTLADHYVRILYGWLMGLGH